MFGKKTAEILGGTCPCASAIRRRGAELAEELDPLNPHWKASDSSCTDPNAKFNVTLFIALVLTVIHGPYAYCNSCKNRGPWPTRLVEQEHGCSQACRLIQVETSTSSLGSALSPNSPGLLVPHHHQSPVPCAMPMLERSRTCRAILANAACTGRGTAQVSVLAVLCPSRRSSLFSISLLPAS